jgi:hypothetical protein
MWISQKVATIQAMVRGLIWKVRVIEICNEKLEAALVIQRAFLGYRGRVAGGQRLFDREVRFLCNDFFLMLTEYFAIIMNYYGFFVLPYRAIISFYV